MKRHIPNLITLLNMACGTTAIVFALEGQWRWAVYLLLAAALFDFLDGLLARLLNAYSETGKQLDSLADMVSFGLLPAFFIYSIFRYQLTGPGNDGWTSNPMFQLVILSSVLIVPIFSAIRLARFNLEVPGELFFHGLPTPAHALFWTGLYWQFMQDGLIFGNSLNIFFLWAIMLIMALYMILPVPMYTMKFEHFRLRGNLIRYLMILIALIILLLTGLTGLSLMILIYILISLLNLLLPSLVSR